MKELPQEGETGDMCDAGQPSHIHELYEVINLQASMAAMELCVSAYDH